MIGRDACREMCIESSRGYIAATYDDEMGSCTCHRMKDPSGKLEKKFIDKAGRSRTDTSASFSVMIQIQ
jgi:hypothetical protein